MEAFTGILRILFRLTSRHLALLAVPLCAALAPAAPALAAAPQVSAGQYHSAALKADGTVWTWGDNLDGQLGAELPEGSATPVKVAGLAGATALSSGARHTLVLKSDGTVWAWGDNYGGALGVDPATDRSFTPVRAGTLAGVAAVSAGTGYSIALKEDGTVWTWGLNLFGQLGNGGTVDDSSPAQVQGLSEVVAVAAGEQHGLALKKDGTVWAWGAGFLGNGTATGSVVPVQVAGLSGVTRIAAGEEHSLAVKSDGSVWGWGRNRFGELGNGTTGARLRPVQVHGLYEVTEVEAGAGCSVALKMDGSVWTWGADNLGRLGNGATSSGSTPVKVMGIPEAAAISAGATQVLVQGRDGSVWAWGANQFGQLGSGGYDFSPEPVQLAGLPAVSAVAAGSSTCYALNRDGSVSAWGGNAVGQLGNGGTADSISPIQVPGLYGVTQLSTGLHHTLALKSDLSVWAWGVNRDGELGNGSTSEYLPSPRQVAGLVGAKAISAGYDHSLSLRGDGTVWGWGDDSSGELGDGGSTMSRQQSTVPLQVPGLPGASAVVGGRHASFASGLDGWLYGWGNHQLGFSAGSSPLRLLELDGMAGVETGSDFALILKSDGTVWAWGDNLFGELGNGTTEPSSTPVQVPGLSEVAAVQAGGWYSLALKRDGTVWAWGLNDFGQLGNGSTEDSALPVRVRGLPRAVAISAGESTALAVASDGTVWGWGHNATAQLARNPGWLPVRSLLDVGADGVTASGTVRSGNNSGAPLAGATVLVAGRTAVTAADGSFLLAGIPAGTHTLTVSLDGYAKKTVSGFFIDRDRTDLVFFLLPDEGYLLDGTVRKKSTTGPGLPGATVSIAGRTATTDADGKFRIAGIPAGSHTLTISRDGYAEKSVSGFEMAGNRTGLDFFLVPAGTFTLRGIVRKAGGAHQPIQGAAVVIAGTKGVTSSSGAFAVTGIPAGAHELRVAKNGYLSFSDSAYRVDRDRRGLEFRLTRAPNRSLSGMVRSGSDTGPPLPGATVSISGRSVTTTSTGAFYLQGIASGNYAITVSKEGFSPATVPGFVLDTDKEGLVFHLQPAPDLTGTAAGAGLAGR